MGYGKTPMGGTRRGPTNTTATQNVARGQIKSGFGQATGLAQSGRKPGRAKKPGGI